MRDLKIDLNKKGKMRDLKIDLNKSSSNAWGGGSMLPMKIKNDNSIPKKVIKNRNYQTQTAMIPRSCNIDLIIEKATELQEQKIKYFENTGYQNLL